MTRTRVYVLQEGAPCDDISVVESLETVDLGDPAWAWPSVPCVLASADRGTVRPWCEERGIRLVPKEFFPGQVDDVIWFGSDHQRQAFEQKWIKDRG